MQTDQNTDQKKIRQGVARWIYKNLVYIVLFGAALFLASDDWGWGMAWVYIGVYFLNQLTLTFLLSPDLLTERSEPQEGSKSWDILLTSIAVLLMPLAAYTLAGLDHKRALSALSPALQVAATVITLLGIALTTWAMTSNRFFSALVRIQGDRGHVVQSGGPYRFVRHPGYLGGVLHHVAMPLMLGSWLALIPGAIGASLLIVRTALEDKVLHTELPGYADYAEHTRYRLLPGIW